MTCHEDGAWPYTYNKPTLTRSFKTFFDLLSHSLILYKLCLDLKAATHIHAHVPTSVEVTKQAYHGPPFTDMLLIVPLPSLVFHHHFRTFLLNLLIKVEQSAIVELARKNLRLKEILTTWGENFHLRFMVVVPRI